MFGFIIGSIAGFVAGVVAGVYVERHPQSRVAKWLAKAKADRFGGGGQ